MRAVALLGLHADRKDIRPFEAAGVNIFSGNDLDAADRPDAALIFGGDGTIHRHLPVLSAHQIPTLVVPLGSANDFAKSIGIDSVATARNAWRTFCSGEENVHAIDLGTVTETGRDAEPWPDAASDPPGRKLRDQGAAPGDEAERLPAAPEQPWSADTLQGMHFVPDGPRRDLPKMAGRIMRSQLRRAQTEEAERLVAGPALFACIAGTGLDAAVNRLTLNQSPWVRGHGGYVLALMQVLARFRPPRITVSVEERGGWRKWMDEPGFLIAAGNGPQYGSGMRLTHEARMDDGKLDVCFVRQMSKLRLLRLFHVVFKGEHIGMKEVEYRRAERVRIETDPVTEVFADGEYVCRTPVEIGVTPGALRVIVPKS